MAMLGISTIYSKAWLVTNTMGAPEILHGSHLSFFLPSLMASMMVERPLHIMAMLHMIRYCQGLFTVFSTAWLVLEEYSILSTFSIQDSCW